MGVESVGVEAAPYGPRRFPHLPDHINRQPQGSFAEGLESKGLKFWADANSMGSYVFGSPMATQAAERSKSEGTQSSSQNSSDNFRFGGFAGASTLSNTAGGCVNRTVSVSELFEFRTSGGRAGAKPSPTVLKDPGPVTSPFSSLNIPSGDTNFIGSSSVAPGSFSNVAPKVVSSDAAVAADRRESSAAASGNSKYATSSFSSFTAGLDPNTSSGFSSRFVFTAGTSDTGSKPGNPANVSSDRLYSGLSRPVCQSNVSTDSLLSGTSGPAAQSKVATDSSIPGSSGPSLQTTVSKDTAVLDPFQPSVHSNVSSGNLCTGPSRPVAQPVSLTETTSLGSSKPSSRSSLNFDKQSAASSKPVRQPDISFEELLSASTAPSMDGGLSKPSTHASRVVKIVQDVDVDMSRKFKRLDIDKGRSCKNLNLNIEAEKTVRSTTVRTTGFTVDPQVEQKLRKLDIDKGESLPVKLDKLDVKKEPKNPSEGKSTFVFGTQGASFVGGKTSSRSSGSVPFFFGNTATSTGQAASFPPYAENQSFGTPSAAKLSSPFKFSTEGEVRHTPLKTKKDKLQHRPLRQGLRSNIKGKKGGLASSRERSEAASPSPSREGVSMDISPPGSSRSSGSVPFVFGGTATSTAQAASFTPYTENQRFETPSAANLSSHFKFSAEGEVRPSPFKIKKDKLQHRPLRQGLRPNMKGKKGGFASSRGRSEAASPSPSREGESMDISPPISNLASTSCQSGCPDVNSSLVPEYDEVDSGEEVGGPLEAGSYNELEASIQKLRAAVTELNFGARTNGSNENLNAASSSHVRNHDSWMDGKKDDVDTSSSTSYGQSWNRTTYTDTQSSERKEPENGSAEAGYVINEVNDKSRANVGAVAHESAMRNEDSTEPLNSRDSGAPQKVEGEGKTSPFTFSASPTGMSTSNLRRRTRKVQKNVGRVTQADKVPGPVMQPDRSNSRPLTTSKSGNWSGSTTLLGLGGSGYGDGVNAAGGIGAAAAEQVCERWRLRGNQAYAKGDFVKAEEFYSLGAGSVPPHETSQSCIRASMLCYSNRAATRMVVGRMREALADCMHAMAVDPSFVRVHLRAASCHLALGETGLAATAFKECLRQAKEASKLDSKVLTDASEGLKKAQQAADYCSQARKFLQNTSAGDSVSALRLLNEALLASPQSEWLIELKAYALISLQRYSEAVQVSEQSLALAERNCATSEGTNNGTEYSPLGWRRRVIAKANFHLGKLEESLEQLQQLHEGPSSMVTPDPESPGAMCAEMALPSLAVIRDLLRHKLEGNKSFQAGKYAEALEHYTAALARNGESRPFCAVCLCNRAAASQALGHIADAIADCSRAIALDPRYAKAISRRAALHEKVRDYGQSCNDLGRLIAIYERQPHPQGLRSQKGTGSQDASAGTTSLEELQQSRERLAKAEEELRKGHPLDHYSILGLELGCSANEIKKAYRKAALRHHPDKAGQFLMRSGDIGDDPGKESVDESVRKDGERLIDEVRKDSEQLFKLIGEAYAVLSDPAKRSRYDAEEELRKLRTRSSDLAKNVFNDRKHSRTNDGANVGQAKGGWVSSGVGGESGSQSRASRQRERWEGFNYQYQRWHPDPDAAQPDVYARRGRPTGSTYGSSQRSTSWQWEENAWDDV